MIAVTRDSISLRGAGVVTITQQKKGARFTLDSVLLADFCTIKKPNARVLEPGAGTGIISLLLAKKFPSATITAIEVQPAVADLCRCNIRDNGLNDRISLLEQDIRALSTLKPSAIDVIVANPPYTRMGSGRQSPQEERLSSRHDRLGPIASWLDLQLFLKNKGRYILAFPCDRLAELTSCLRARKLEPKRLRFVHSYLGKPASLVLVETIKSARIGLEILPPLVIYQTEGVYTEEMRRIYDLP